MEITTYAPVIIPTLNRYDHFRQCLESLEECTGADKTEVYVSLDYPPQDAEGNLIQKYVEGWKQIDAYLAEKETANGFKKLVVFRQDHNLGVSGPTNNYAFLHNYIERFDRYITSEDDNIFAPCFLEFINKGLEKFKDDKSVFAINGYSHPYPIKTDKNTFFRQNVDFSAWGYGIWTDKYTECLKWANPKYFKDSYSLHNLRKLMKNGYNRTIAYLSYCTSKQEIVLNDNGLSVYMAVNDMDVVMPTLSLVRNMGWDDSGINCSTENKVLANSHTKQTISQEPHFDFFGTGNEYYDENKKIFIESSYARLPIKYFFVALIKFFIKRFILFR